MADMTRRSFAKMLAAVAAAAGVPAAARPAMEAAALESPAEEWAQSPDDPDEPDFFVEGASRPENNDPHRLAKADPADHGLWLDGERVAVTGWSSYFDNSLRSSYFAITGDRVLPMFGRREVRLEFEAHAEDLASMMRGLMDRRDVRVEMRGGGQVLSGTGAISEAQFFASGPSGDCMARIEIIFFGDVEIRAL